MVAQKERSRTGQKTYTITKPFVPNDMRHSTWQENVRREKGRGAREAHNEEGVKAHGHRNAVSLISSFTFGNFGTWRYRLSRSYANLEVR